MKSPITTHVLDTALGRPASGIAVALARREPSGEWRELAHGQTDNDGRIMNWLPADFRLTAGTYQVTFNTASYFQQRAVPSFYPSVSIVFEIAHPEQHYHVPLLLSPFGYSTYRGS